MTEQIRRPPPTNSVELDRWNFELWRRLANSNLLDIAWDSISKVGSALSDLESRAHSQLTSILGVDVTDTNTVQNKHISNADAKRWEEGLGNISAGIGSGTFAGPTGVLVTFDERSTIDYMLVISANNDASGHNGDIWFVPLTTASARVYNSGLAGGTFKFKVLT